MRGVACGGSEGASEKAVVVFFSVEDLSSRFTFGGLLFFPFGVDETTTDREARLGVSGIPEQAAFLV